MEVKECPLEPTVVAICEASDIAIKSGLSIEQFLNIAARVFAEKTDMQDSAAIIIELKVVDVEDAPN